MTQRSTGRSGMKRAAQRRGGIYETPDAVLAGVLYMDKLQLLSTERRGDQVVFVFRARPGLARQVRQIVKLAEESEQASVEIRARMNAALAADQSLRACGEISGPNLTRFLAGVEGIMERTAR